LTNLSVTFVLTHRPTFT